LPADRPYKIHTCFWECYNKYPARDIAYNIKKIELNGILDYTNYEDYENRTWHFKILGYGHDEHF